MLSSPHADYRHPHPAHDRRDHRRAVCRRPGRAGLRLRVDARSALQRLAFTVPAALLPRQSAKPRKVGFVRVFVAGESQRRRFELTLPRKGTAKVLFTGAGKPTVRLAGGGLQVEGLPDRSAVAEITLYRVKKLDGATKKRTYRLRALLTRTGAPVERFSVNPRPPR